MKLHPYRLGWNLRQYGISIDTIRDEPDLWAEFKTILSAEQISSLLTDWWFLARDEQLPPPQKVPGVDWKFWLYLAGRGSGKTRTGAEWVRERIKAGGHIGSLIAPTAGDARDVMVEGESGLINVCQESDTTYQGVKIGKPLYESSKRRVTWKNGAYVILFSADEPERLRGPQSEFIWADEIKAWRYLAAFDMALFGLRLGKLPQIFASTTPALNRIIKKLYYNALKAEEGKYVLTIGKTERNIHNLAPSFVEDLRADYKGTSMERAELDGELLEELDGALWSRWTYQA